MRRVVVPTALALLLPLAACGSDDDRTLTVLAAASLTDVFEELALEFEEEHDVDVAFSFGSSTTLAEQAAEAAPGGVLATADETAMQVATDAGATGEVVAFARNRLVIVTPPGNPAGVESLTDLGAATWVRCADEVPCGRVALGVLDDHAVTAEPASLEEDVRAAVDKVASGEADAGLVYATDAVAAGDRVATVEIPDAESRATTYLVSTLDQADDPELAREWLDLLISAKGRRVLGAAGFGLQ